MGCFLETTDRDAPPCLKVGTHTAVKTTKCPHKQEPCGPNCAVPVLQREQGHYYGCVYFRQVRDKSLKRGYFQKVGDEIQKSMSSELKIFSDASSVF